MAIKLPVNKCHIYLMEIAVGAGMFICLGISLDIRD